MTALLDAPAVLANDADYQPGKILYASWGYDQTNINWYKIVKRSGMNVILQELEAIESPKLDLNGNSYSMTGTSVPNLDKPINKPIRRKLATRDGAIIGCNYTSSYGWISAWNGKPKGYTSYA